MVPNIKPTIFPTRRTTRELVLDVFLVHPLPKLKAGPTDYSDVLFTGLRFQMKKIAEEIEVGFYA
jgi:hypothetical protein